MKLLQPHQLNQLKESDAVVYTYCQQTKNLKHNSLLKQAGKLLKQNYTPAFPATNPDEPCLKTVTLKDIEKLASFLSSCEKSDLYVCSTYKELSLSILILGFIVREGLAIQYAIAEAVKQDLATEPALWFLMVADHYLDLSGVLVEKVEEYLETGIAVTKEPKIIKAEWYEGD
jgi:hypothetical protein